jgi:IS30 family transposase
VRSFPFKAKGDLNMKTKNDDKKNLHLSLADRIEIQECLSHGMTFKAIGKRIGKDQTTVSKEVKKRIDITPTAVKRTNGKGEVILSPCPKLMKPPFVCNPCPLNKRACSFDKHIYRAAFAQDGYKTLLREAREGIPLTKEEFWKIDRVVSKGIRDGQHLFHILNSNNLDISMPTAYRHFHKDYFSVSIIDLPRVVKLKPRRKRREAYIPRGLKVGRSFNDFLLRKEENELIVWWEMDTVIGRPGGKCILTFNFVPCNFMFGLLLENKTASEVSDKICKLKSRLSAVGIHFGDIFPEILTDNGGEFANVSAIENDRRGWQETYLFFTDPFQSSQKPRVEKNHSCLRSILPKGMPFDDLTQEHLDVIFSHMNSAKRKSLNAKTAFEMFCYFHNAETATAFGISEIAPHEVVQNKRLLETLAPKPKN